MATVALAKQTFEQTVTGDGIVLVDFWAGWCGPCRRFAPVFEQASAQHPDIVFGKVDTEAEPELSAAARISYRAANELTDRVVRWFIDGYYDADGSPGERGLDLRMTPNPRPS